MANYVIKMPSYIYQLFNYLSATHILSQCKGEWIKKKLYTERAGYPRTEETTDDVRQLSKIRSLSGYIARRRYQFAFLQPN